MPKTEDVQMKTENVSVQSRGTSPIDRDLDNDIDSKSEILDVDTAENGLREVTTHVHYSPPVSPADSKDVKDITELKALDNNSFHDDTLTTKRSESNNSIVKKEDIKADLELCDSEGKSTPKFDSNIVETEKKKDSTRDEISSASHMFPHVNQASVDDEPAIPTSDEDDSNESCCEETCENVSTEDKTLHEPSKYTDIMRENEKRDDKCHDENTDKTLNDNCNTVAAAEDACTTDSNVNAQQSAPYDPYQDPLILQAADGLELLSALAEQRTKTLQVENSVPESDNNVTVSKETDSTDSPVNHNSPVAKIKKRKMSSPKFISKSKKETLPHFTFGGISIPAGRYKVDASFFYIQEKCEMLPVQPSQ